MKRKNAGKPGRGGAPRAGGAGDYADPYQKARRPRAAAGDAPPAFARRPRAGAGENQPYARERRPPRRGAGEGGFTVTLDPDVARVFRGDASVNRALRLVLQLMQVVQGPPRAFGPRPERAAREQRPRHGYQGSSEARGFTRKPRFEAEDEQ